MQPSISLIHVLIAVFIIILVLLQHGKGADVGVGFGSGASNTMFGSAGATPFLVKVTIVLAAGFFATSIGLSYLASCQLKAAMKVPCLRAAAPFKNFQPETRTRSPYVTPKW